MLDLKKLEFKTSINGYNKEQVNTFIDQIINEMERVVEYNAKLEKDVSNLQAQLLYFKEMEDILNQALISAQVFGTTLKQSASKESELILKEAERNANKLINDAMVRMQRVEIEIENLKKTSKVYKSRLKNIIQSQLEIIEDIEDDYEKLRTSDFEEVGQI